LIPWLGHYELGRALLNQNRLPEALAAAEEAQRFAPKALLVYRLLSNIHRLQQNYPALLADLNAYIDLDPDSPAGFVPNRFVTKCSVSTPIRTSTLPRCALEICLSVR